MAQPGDKLAEAILTGQVDGNRLGQLLFQLGPALPFEAGFPFPRFVGQGGFQQAIPPASLAVPVIPAPAPAAPVLAAQPVQVVAPPAAPAAQPAPRAIGGMIFRSPVVTSTRVSQALRGI